MNLSVKGLNGNFLSGDLDRVFTALYELGMIEPMLGKDWGNLYDRSQFQWKEVGKAIKEINKIVSIKEMRSYIESLSQEVVEALVLEVAREMAEFQERKETIH